MSTTAPDAPALDTRELRRTFGRFATGVTVVTCLDAVGTPVGVTANSFSSVSLDPPLVLWSIDKGALSYGAFEAASHFAFSVLGLDQVEVSNRFARQGVDKFAGVPWERGAGGVPLLSGAAAYVECERFAAFPGGDHLILVGRVVAFRRGEGAALIFAEGRYGALAPHPATDGPTEPGDADERHPYDDFLLPLLFRAYTHLFRAFSGTLASEGATGAEMRLLSVLAAHGPAADAPLLTQTMLSRSAMDEAAEALAGEGLIEASGGRTAITADGRAKLSELLTAAAERERQSTTGLDRSEAAMLRTLLQKLVRQHESPAETAS